jgi:beta-lactam-binding protein with PASTA domain
MVRWLATPLLVVGLGVDGVAIWSRVQAQPILYVTEVQTPNVIGIDVLAAKAKIVDAGLTPGSVVEVDSYTAPRGIVIGQGPGPGQRVVLGYEMRLYVSKGPVPK